MLTKFLSFIFNEEIANCSYNFKNLRILDSSEIKNTSTYIMTDRKAKLLPIFIAILLCCSVTHVTCCSDSTKLFKLGVVRKSFSSIPFFNEETEGQRLRVFVFFPIAKQEAEPNFVNPDPVLGIQVYVCSSFK